jgi:hypothetical protein
VAFHACNSSWVWRRDSFWPVGVGSLVWAALRDPHCHLGPTTLVYRLLRCNSPGDRRLSRAYARVYELVVVICPKVSEMVSGHWVIDMSSNLCSYLFRLSTVDLRRNSCGRAQNMALVGEALKRKVLPNTASKCDHEVCSQMS